MLYYHRCPALAERGEQPNPPRPRIRMREPSSTADATLLKEKLGPLPEPTARPVVIMVSGLPGTGKSYLSRRLAERFPAIILETDALRRMLFPSPNYGWEENRRLFPALHRLIEDLLKRGIPLIFDATNLLEHQREYIYRSADQTGAKLIIVQTEAPKEVVAQRLAGRGRGIDRADRSEATWDVYLKMKATVEKIRRNHFVVDTSKDITPAVEKILREAKHALRQR